MNPFFSSNTTILQKQPSRIFLITLILIFMLWTPFLIKTTLSVQHSCNPLIYLGKDALPEECRENETRAEDQSLFDSIRSRINLK